MFRLAVWVAKVLLLTQYDSMRCGIIKEINDYLMFQCDVALAVDTYG